MRELIKRKEEDYYTCSRCEVHSMTKGRVCPCPRGSCEAKISGTVITEKYIETELTAEQTRFNKENYR
jgi:hypothetical protein